MTAMNMKAFFASLFFTFAAFGQMTIVSVTPSTGPTTGGTEVIIAGTEFTEVCGPITCLPPTVYFGNTPAASTTVLNASTVRAITPPHFPGTVDVRFEQGVSSVTRPAAFTFLGGPPEETFERVLLPVLLPPVSGAFGSVFETEFQVTTTGGTLSMYGLRYGNCAPVTCLDIQPIVLQTTNDIVRADQVLYNGTPGRFLFVPRNEVSRMSANLRVYDSSRTEANFGTEIPVVRESEFRSHITLLGIPRHPRFRTKVRLYSTRATALTVRPSNGPAFGVTLMPSGSDVHAPAYAEFNVEASGLGAPVTLQITQAPSPLPVVPPPFWAFATVTNNDTQVLTTISPQP